MNEPSTKYHLRWFGRECICNYLFLAKLESHADEYLIAQDKEFIFQAGGLGSCMVGVPTWGIGDKKRERRPNRLIRPAFEGWR